MKALSLIQPWAELIALGEKKIETRSWSTKYRGELFIHASKKVNHNVFNSSPFIGVLTNHAYTTAGVLPVGEIIAKCKLVDCKKIIQDMGNYAVLEDLSMVTGNEYLFGDYSTPGRYAWILENVVKFDEPIPAKGQLGLWEYKGVEVQ